MTLNNINTNNNIVIVIHFSFIKVLV